MSQAQIFTSYYKSPVGWLRIEATDVGLKNIDFVDQSSSSGTHPVLKKTEKQLSEYFDGKRTDFDIPFDLDGTEFQQNVWKALCTIPYGQTISYKQLAEKVNNPKASRAVGNANGKNNIPIIIPCHRVIASDGSLGGYTSGVGIKEKLLLLEKS